MRPSAEDARLELDQAKRDRSPSTMAQKVAVALDWTPNTNHTYVMIALKATHCALVHPDPLPPRSDWDCPRTASWTVCQLTQERLNCAEGRLWEWWQLQTARLPVLRSSSSEDTADTLSQSVCLKGGGTHALLAPARPQPSRLCDCPHNTHCFCCRCCRGCRCRPDTAASL